MDKDSKASKASKFDNIKVMGPVFKLEAPAKLLQVLRATAERFDAGMKDIGRDQATSLLLGDKPEEWQQKVAALVDRCQDVELEESERDEALIKLVELDKRYLGEELVVAKVLLWWMQVLGKKRRWTGNDETERLSRGEQAAKNLAGITKAIKNTGGRKMFSDPSDLLSYYDDAALLFQSLKDKFESIQSLGDAKASEFATELGLSDHVVQQVLAEYKQHPVVCTRLILADMLNLAAETLKKPIEAARKLRAEGHIRPDDAEQRG